MFWQRVLLGSLFVEIDTKSWGLVRMHEPIVHGRRSREDFSRGISKVDTLLNSEVVDRQIEVRIGSVAYRRDIRRPMPSRANIKPLAQGCELPRYTQSTDLGDMHSNEVD